MDIYSLDKCGAESHCIYLVEKGLNLSDLGLSSAEEAFLERSLEKKQRLIFINRLSNWLVLVYPDEDKKGAALKESYRLDGSEIQKWACKNKISALHIEDKVNIQSRLFAFSEGLILGNYQFLKYFADPAKKQNSLVDLGIVSSSEKFIEELNILVNAVYFTRDFINEPLSTLTAPIFAERIKELGVKTGFQVEVLDKEEIESLKMGGLLAVNKGSIDPPRFCILSHEPEKAVNEKALVLVGKGIVYDTGGLSLKPTPNSMDYMKSDMSGAAAVVGLIYALSSLNWPVRVIGLIPATDNRPDGNAYVPGDIIKMHNGLFVEVLNTDAEGRMILADALRVAMSITRSGSYLLA